MFLVIMLFGKLYKHNTRNPLFSNSDMSFAMARFIRTVKAHQGIMELFQENNDLDMNCLAFPHNSMCNTPIHSKIYVSVLSP